MQIIDISNNSLGKHGVDVARALIESPNLCKINMQNNGIKSGSLLQIKEIDYGHNNHSKQVNPYLVSALPGFPGPLIDIMSGFCFEFTIMLDERLDKLLDELDRQELGNILGEFKDLPEENNEFLDRLNELSADQLFGRLSASSDKLSTLSQIIEKGEEDDVTGEGDDIDLGWINSYFGKYTMQGLSKILNLRISDLGVEGAKVIPGTFFSQSDNNVSEVLSQVHVSAEKIILVPLNISRHAVGLIFEKFDDIDSLKVTYFDPLNKPIPKDLQRLLQTDNVVLEERVIEQQKYSNCGPEVIENFIFYLTGQRVSQEEAVELHSMLIESGLITKDTASEAIDYTLYNGSCEIEVLGD